VSWSEFKAMCRDTLKVLDDDVQLNLVFQSLDVDNSRQISIEEFSAFLKDEALQTAGEVPGAVVVSSPERTPEDAPPKWSQDLSVPVHKGFLLFETNVEPVRGYCQLFKDRLDAWQGAANAERKEPAEGSIAMCDVLSWRVHKEFDSGAGRVANGSVTLNCGDVVKKVLFQSKEEANQWIQAFGKVLMPPMQAGTFKPWKADRIGKWGSAALKNAPKGKHHLVSTKASRAPRYEPVQLASLKVLFRAPVFYEDIKALDDEAGRILKRESERKKVVSVVTAMRTRLRDAAWTAGGSNWAKLFRIEDKDRSGHLDWDEFRSMARRMLKLNEDRAPDAQLRAVFNSLDADGSGYVEYEELVAFVEDPVERMRARLCAAAVDVSDWTSFFQNQDSDKSGALDWPEFQAMCRKRLNLLDDDPQLGMIFEAIDADDSGTISTEEFVTFVNERAAGGMASGAPRPKVERMHSVEPMAAKWLA